MPFDPAPYDVAIVGGGIVGLATALALTEMRPGIGVVVIEGESRWAGQQTGHNSGVLHSGIYYPPGSDKARFATSGRRETIAFCTAEKLPVQVCGKVIVAVEAAELGRVDALVERGRANGVTLERLDSMGIREHEPHARGVAGIFVHDTGICDFAAVARRYARIAERNGAHLVPATAVTGLAEDEDGVRIDTDRGAIRAHAVVVCAGLASDRIDIAGASAPPARIVPFRGDYYSLRAGSRYLVRNLIYPVPDPALPFLGVHLTRRVDGDVLAGPNAVLALRRRPYGSLRPSPRDLADILSYRGFRHLARQHWRTGAGELARTLSRRAFASAAARLIPELTAADLQRATAGVRAQAVAPDGDLLDDFLVDRVGRVLRVLNAPSPAATAALPIGRELAQRALAG